MIFRRGFSSERFVEFDEVPRSHRIMRLGPVGSGDTLEKIAHESQGRSGDLHRSDFASWPACTAVRPQEVRPQNTPSAGKCEGTKKYFEPEQGVWC